MIPRQSKLEATANKYMPCNLFSDLTFTKGIKNLNKVIEIQYNEV